ncbi:MAG: hypothetical protein AB9903_09515 [Vulcanimicrobiota bacterium]
MRQKTSGILWKRKREKGSLLIMSLLLSLVLLILGMAFLTVKSMRYKGSAMAGAYAQVSAIAEAGIEDARIKIAKDPEFPPPGDKDQNVFCYSESVLDIDGTTLIGTYTVTIDSSMNYPPYLVIRITSTGLAGPLEEPYAKKTIETELDMSEKLRDNPAAVNPNFFRFINWKESGSL